jgi:hypothetical protein
VSDCRTGNGNASAVSHTRAPVARVMRTPCGSGCGGSAPATSRAAINVASATSRSPPSADRPARAASARNRKRGVLSAYGGDGGTGPILPTRAGAATRTALSCSEAVTPPCTGKSCAAALPGQ